jgi:predicted phage tail protein
MKLKSLLQIATVCFLIFLSSCTKNENVSNLDSTSTSKEMVFRSVTEKEYQEATPFTKRLIDKIDASANALNIIEKNSSVQYEATFIISNDENKIFNNSLVISPIESNKNNASSNKKSFAENTPDGKCHICGVSSAYSCIKEVTKYMDQKHTNEVDVHVKRGSDGCVDVTYK